MRDWLLTHPDEHTGTDWAVKVERFMHRRLDFGMATMRLGADLLAPFTVETEYQTVRLIPTKAENRGTDG